MSSRSNHDNNPEQGESTTGPHWLDGAPRPEPLEAPAPYGGPEPGTPEYEQGVDEFNYAQRLGENAATVGMWNKAERMAQREETISPYANLDNSEQAAAQILAAKAEYEADHNRRVSDKLAELQVAQDAKRLLIAAESQTHTLPRRSTMAERLAAPRTPTPWRVASMWPEGGRVNLASVPKGGKTLMTVNLVRSLLTGQPFLNHFDVTPVPDRDGPSIVVFDFEMTEEQILDWYERIDLPPEVLARVDVVPLRGYAGLFDFLTPTTRAELVAKYRGAHTYIMDPVGPVLAGLGMEENSNSDVQRFLSTWDQFVHELGGVESMVSIHAGHNGDRARGASAFLGSGDAVWTIAREGDAASDPRFLKAIGRGVDLEPTELVHDPDTGRVSLGTQNRAQVKRDNTARQAFPFVLMALEQYGPGTPTTLWEQVSRDHGKTCEDFWEVSVRPFRDALPLMAKEGQIRAEPMVPRGVRYMLQ